MKDIFYTKFNNDSPLIVFDEGKIRIEPNSHTTQTFDEKTLGINSWSYLPLYIYIF